jgi:hypothetical protein
MPTVSAVGTLPLTTFRAYDPGRHIDARLLTFHARAADQAHAAFTPGTTWPVIGTPARLIAGEQPDPPLSMPTTFMLTTPQQHTPTRTPRRTPLERLPGPHLTGSSPAFSGSLTTTVFSQRSIRWFDASPRRATPEGHKASISSTAPPMKDAVYMASSSAFVTHGCRINPQSAPIFCDHLTADGPARRGLVEKPTVYTTFLSQASPNRARRCRCVVSGCGLLTTPRISATASAKSGSSNSDPPIRFRTSRWLSNAQSSARGEA